MRIQTPALDAGTENNVVAAVAQVTGAPVSGISIEAVGPTFGATIARRALEALVVFLSVVALFISWRLQWKMALAGLAALLHDMILTIGVYAITGFEVTPATVIAFLTILGYSLYDTVVVFDKVVELDHDLGDRLSFDEVVNAAMNNVLVRSVLTSLTSLLPVGSLLFVGALIFGAATLQDFALALFVGIAAGTYSSIFVAAPLLAMWHRDDDRRSAARRPTNTKVARTAPSTPTLPQRGVISGSGARPRPPKKRKR